MPASQEVFEQVEAFLWIACIPRFEKSDTNKLIYCVPVMQFYSQNLLQDTIMIIFIHHKHGSSKNNKCN